MSGVGFGCLRFACCMRCLCLGSGWVWRFGVGSEGSLRFTLDLVVVLRFVCFGGLIVVGLFCNWRCAVLVDVGCAWFMGLMVGVC